jgi:hypothetical protein
MARDELELSDSAEAPKRSIGKHAQASWDLLGEVPPAQTDKRRQRTDLMRQAQERVDEYDGLGAGLTPENPVARTDEAPELRIGGRQLERTGAAHFAPESGTDQITVPPSTHSTCPVM